MSKAENKIMRRRLMNAYLSSVISISLVLLLVGVASMLLVNAKSVSDYFKENMQVSVLMKQNVSDEKALEFREMLEDAEDKIYPVVFCLFSDNISSHILQQGSSGFILLAIPVEEGFADVLNQVSIVGDQDLLTPSFESFFEERRRSVLAVLRFSADAQDFGFTLLRGIGFGYRFMNFLIPAGCTSHGRTPTGLRFFQIPINMRTTIAGTTYTNTFRMFYLQLFFTGHTYSPLIH